MRVSDRRDLNPQPADYESARSAIELQSEIDEWSLGQDFHPHTPIYKIGALICHPGLIYL